ncbi:biotin transporter BioY [Sulfobacillus thermotolerans]|uniref:biotin transporter BioY n=1 Tax=Sulfobacillus thermotolerans TaxID=338644 RepID=UPI0033682EC6
MPQSMRFLVLAGFVTAMTAVGALTSFTIPLFSVVPFTLQVLGVYLAGGLLPPRWAFMSMITYVLLGVLGLPVFAEGSHGIGILLGPFGGYLWAYPPAAWLIARLAPAPLLLREFILFLANSLDALAPQSVRRSFP